MTDENTVEPEQEPMAQEPEAQVEADTQVAESSAASEEQHEQKSNGVQERINKLTAQKYEEKAKAEAALKRAQELEAKLASQEKPSVGIELPDPDLMYEDKEAYNAKLAEYHQAMAAKTFEQQQQQAALRAQQEAQAREQAEIQSTFANNATQHGIEVEEAFNAAQTLVDRGMQQTLGKMLLEIPNSAVMTAYLAKNPEAYEQVNSQRTGYAMAQALQALESKALAKKVSSAPEPIPDIKGQTKPETSPLDNDPMFKDATFS